MIVNITLTEEGPPFWLLGDPRAVRVALNYGKPGPTPVDFEDLSDNERRRILKDLQLGYISVDCTFDQLREVYLRLAPPPPKPSPEVQSVVEQRKARHEMAVQLQEKRAADQKKFLKDCEALSKKGVRAIRAALKDKVDLRQVRTLRELEVKRKKPRSSVLLFLDSLQKRQQAEIVKDIEESTNETPLKNPYDQETIRYDVVESEQEVVHLTPDRLAQGETL